jgi:hypothetical protein
MGFYQGHLVVKGAEEVKDKNTTLANVQISVMLHAIFPRTSKRQHHGAGLVARLWRCDWFCSVLGGGLFLSS